VRARQLLSVVVRASSYSISKILFVN